MLKRNEKVSRYELPITIDSQKGGGFLASCAIWKDCYAQGETIDEAVLEIIAVAQSLIELYKEEGLKIPLKLRDEKNLENTLLMPIIVAS